MTADERALLLTVARVLRAHLANTMANRTDYGIELDYIDVCDALKPFDPSPYKPPSPQADRK